MDRNQTRMDKTQVLNKLIAIENMLFFEALLHVLKQPLGGGISSFTVFHRIYTSASKYL
jgi:hypothetical protein